jgi:hypothetical protein
MIIAEQLLDSILITVALVIVKSEIIVTYAINILIILPLMISYLNYLLYHLN